MRKVETLSMREIAEYMVGALAAGHDLVLVTVTGGGGSSPRHAGSQMLVGAQGLACGTIGGGALEGHAIAEARALLGGDEGRFEPLNLPSKLGMACGGNSNLLYTPLRGGDVSWVQVAAEMIRRMDARIPANLALRCSRDGRPFESSVALADANGERIAGDCGVPCGRFAAIDVPCFDDGWFVMPLDIPVRAVVFGAGHVGRAVVDALSRVGFACTVFDCRAEFAQAEAFPAAQEVVCADYENIASRITLDERDFALIMTHGHRTDFTVLEQVLRRPCAYVGLMGSRRKIGEARKRMLEAGLPQLAIDSVHMPIGLSIQAETPEEIAISVAAECILQRASLRSA